MLFIADGPHSSADESNADKFVTTHDSSEEEIDFGSSGRVQQEGGVTDNQLNGESVNEKRASTPYESAFLSFLENSNDEKAGETTVEMCKSETVDVDFIPENENVTLDPYNGTFVVCKSADANNELKGDSASIKNSSKPPRRIPPTKLKSESSSVSKTEEHNIKNSDITDNMINEEEPVVEIKRVVKTKNIDTLENAMPCSSNVAEKTVGQKDDILKYLESVENGLSNIKQILKSDVKVPGSENQMFFIEMHLKSLKEGVKKALERYEKTVVESSNSGGILPSIPNLLKDNIIGDTYSVITEVVPLSSIPKSLAGDYKIASPVRITKNMEIVPSVSTSNEIASASEDRSEIIESKSDKETQKADKPALKRKDSQDEDLSIVSVSSPSPTKYSQSSITDYVEGVHKSPEAGSSFKSAQKSPKGGQLNRTGADMSPSSGTKTSPASGSKVSANSKLSPKGDMLAQVKRSPASVTSESPQQLETLNKDNCSKTKEKNIVETTNCKLAQKSSPKIVQHEVQPSGSDNKPSASKNKPSGDLNVISVESTGSIDEAIDKDDETTEKALAFLREQFGEDMFKKIQEDSKKKKKMAPPIGPPLPFTRNVMNRGNKRGGRKTNQNLRTKTGQVQSAPSVPTVHLASGKAPLVNIVNSGKIKHTVPFSIETNTVRKPTGAQNRIVFRRNAAGQIVQQIQNVNQNRKIVSQTNTAAQIFSTADNGNIIPPQPSTVQACANQSVATRYINQAGKTYKLIGVTTIKTQVNTQTNPSQPGVSTAVSGSASTCTTVRNISKGMSPNVRKAAEIKAKITQIPPIKRRLSGDSLNKLLNNYKAKARKLNPSSTVLGNIGPPLMQSTPARPVTNLPSGNTGIIRGGDSDLRIAACYTMKVNKKSSENQDPMEPDSTGSSKNPSVIVLSDSE